MGSRAVAPVVPGSQIPLDLDKELLPICNLVGVPMALIVRPNAPYKTLAELIAYARENPGKDLRLDRQPLDPPTPARAVRCASPRASTPAIAPYPRPPRHRRPLHPPQRH